MKKGCASSKRIENFKRIKKIFYWKLNEKTLSYYIQYQQKSDWGKQESNMEQPETI